MTFTRLAKRILIAALPLVVIVAVVIIVFSPKVADHLAALAIVASLLAFAIPYLDLVISRRREQADIVSEAARTLAREVRGQFEREEKERHLLGEFRIPVRWEVAGGSDPKSSFAATLEGRRSGDLDELVERFERHVGQPGTLGRLVVTGGGGAGKTALCVLLGRALSKGQGEPERIPILFQLSSWARNTPIHDWMAAQLTEAYPFVAALTANDLVRDRVLPLLDGLDELADPATALLRIEEELAGESFVLTCRAGEFATANVGPVLHRALVVEMLPLTAAASRHYLRDYEPGGAGSRLEPLIDALAVHQTGPLAAALSSPLMLSLAVAPGEPLPREMLTAAEPDARDRIEDHLIGTFIRKVFLYRKAKGVPQPPWTREQADDYLTFLAAYADRRTGRLAWWQLHRAVPRTLFLVVAILIGGLGCGAVAALFFAAIGNPLLGFMIGLGVGVVGAFVVELIPQEDPRGAKPKIFTSHRQSPYAIPRSLGFGVIGAVSGALVVSAWYEGTSYVIIGSAMSGLSFALARYLSEPVDPLKAATPDSLLSSDRASVLYSYVLGGLPGALTGAYLGAVFREGGDDALDGSWFDGLATPMQVLVGGLGGLVLSAVGLGLMTHGASSWGRFITTRATLAMRGKTPWQLMRFLREAHRRGVLRQVGGYYVFQHVRLLDHLLGRAAPAELVLAEVSAPTTPTTTGPDKSQ